MHLFLDVAANQDPQDFGDVVPEGRRVESGQALVSLTSMTRPLLVSIDPTPSRLLLVE